MNRILTTKNKSFSYQRIQRESHYPLVFSLLLICLFLANNVFAQQACCPNNIFLNGGFEDASIEDINFPYGTGTANANLTDAPQWVYGDGDNNGADIHIIEDATRATEGSQFVYIPDFPIPPSYNQCIGNTVYASTATACSIEEFYGDTRYIVQLDFAPFNINVPGGGTGSAGPRVEHNFPDITTLYNASGAIVSGTNFFTAVDWANVATSWTRASGVTSAMPVLIAGANKVIYISNDKDATCGMLVDNTIFEMLVVTTGGINNVTCGGATNTIAFNLNPTSNVPVGVPNIKYTVAAPAGYTVSPTTGFYNQETAFTLTVNSGDFSAGTPATVNLTVTDEINTGCPVTVAVNNPFPCPALLTTGLSVGTCNDQGTAVDATDDTYTFALNPTGIALGTTYSLSGDVTASGLSYGTSTTFDNGGAEFLISGGNLSFTITDDDSGETISGIATAPATCSIDFDCDGVAEGADSDDGNPCSPNACVTGCDFSIIENITFAEVGGNTPGASMQYFLTNDNGDIIETSTNARFLPQPIGTYFIYIVAYESAATLQNNNVGDDILNISVAESWACFDVSCPLVIDVCQKAVVGNRIWLDENGDGIQDAGERGIPNVLVELQDGTCTTASDCRTTLTDANGGYIFKNVEAGTYTVKVLSNVAAELNPIFDEDNGTSSPNMETTVTVAANDEYVTADFGYNYASKADTDNPTTTTLGTIGDRVWNDADGNGMQDIGERGIPNVTVNLRVDSDNDGSYETVQATAVTDNYGYYIFDDLSSGAYVLEVVETEISNAGFVTTPTGDPDSDNNNISRAIILAPGDVWLGGDFGYNSSTDPADIGSQVFVDVDADGVYNSSNDQPIRGVTLALIADANGDSNWDDTEEVVATTTTAADGSYLFQDLPAGDYVVVVTDMNNVINDLANSVDPEGLVDQQSGVTLGATDNLIQNFGYAPAGHYSSTDAFIGNMVFLDLDGGNDYDAGEPGIEGVEIELLDGTTNAVLSTTTTDENGMYYFGNLDADNYKVSVVTSSLPAGLENSIDPNGNSPGTNTTLSFPLAAGASDLTIDFGYKATTAYNVSGTIWEDETAEGTLDGSETARFENVTLYLIDVNNNVVGTTETAANGTYSFAQVSSGSYTVEVETTDDALLGYWHTTGADSESDPVAVTVSGANVTDLDFGYYKRAAALGNVVWEDDNGNGLQDAAESGIAGVVVLLEIDYDNNGTYDVTVATLTDIDGAYSFDNLLLDEDYNGTGATPTYKISMEIPGGYSATQIDVNTNGNDKEDSDDPAGVIAVTTQGQNDMTKLATPTTEVVAASYDFGLSRTSAIGNYVWVDEDGDGGQDAGERGIPNVRMDLLDNGGVLIKSTTTDDNGGYIFTNLLGGTYTVRVSSGTLPSGLTHQTYDLDGTANNETTVLLRGDEIMTADFGYNWAPAPDTDTPGTADIGAIGSRVWNDADSDGMQDPGEAGIENVTLELWTDSNANGEYTYSGISTTTDAAGRYIFDDLPALGYVIRVDESTITSDYSKTPTADPDSDSDNISEPILLAPGDVYLNMNFGYNAPTSYTIGSTVYLDENGNEAFNTESGIPGVTVSLQDGSGNMIASTTTDDTGAYAFPGLPNGSYKVVITDTENVLNNLTESGDPDGATARESVVTISGADELAENFGFAPQGHTATQGLIGNLVFLDTNGSDTYDAGEPGIEGVTLKLEDPVSGRILSTTVTDENGHYYFGNLSAGDYEVVLDETSLPAGLTNSVDPDNSGAGNESGTITLAAAAIDLVQDFGYKATTPYTLSGTIWEDVNADGMEDETGTTLESVMISLYDTDGNIVNTTMTDAAGFYEFAGLPNGDYVVEVNPNTAILNGFWHSKTSGSTDNQADPFAATIAGANVPEIDFGYHIIGAALGNKIWLDYNEDDMQDANEPGLPGAKITLEIDYDNDATPDVYVVRQSDVNGNYSFKGLLLDEDYNGTGTTPTYEVVVTLPDADMDASYTETTADVGGDDKVDSDTHIGQIATLVQGQRDVSVQPSVGTEAIEAGFDFGYTLDCTIPKVDYAMTADASDSGAAQTTDYFVDGTSNTTHRSLVQNDGEIRSWTYCEIGAWKYYYNPLDPDEFLFAIEHGSNTTEIEYVEVRVDDNATDRHAASATDATFVMVRDWHIKTVGDVALTAPVNVRFYFPPNEYKQMLDAAKAQATTWGTSVQPTEAMVQWFNKPVFDPDVDINTANSILPAFDETSSRVAASDADGNNTSLTGVENDRNHIQFDGITGFSGGGGTAMIHLDIEALPVELSRFTGTPDGCDIRLNWIAETEEGFSHYELERRSDDVDYQKIEEIKGTGGLTLSQAYQYYDKEAGEDNYYRLKMIDLDGSFEYSPVVFVKGCEANNELTVYPNPVGVEQGLINVKFYSPEEGDVMLEVTDILGQVIKRLNLASQPSWNTVRMDITDLPAGAYFLKRMGDKGAIQFVVQE